MAVEPKRDDGDEHDGAAHTIVLVAVGAAVDRLEAGPGVRLRRSR
jgi:hypothetical protein